MQEYPFRLHQKQQRSKREHNETTKSDFKQTSAATDRLQTLFFGAQKWRPSVSGEAGAKNFNFKKHQVINVDYRDVIQWLGN